MISTSDPRLAVYAGARAVVTGGLGLIGPAIAASRHAGSRGSAGRRRHRPGSLRRSTCPLQRGRGICEGAFADFAGIAPAVGVRSGADALEPALRGCGIGANDLVFGRKWAHLRPNPPLPG